MNRNENTMVATARKTAAGKYLIVNLASESYGMPVLSVREIIRLPHITPVPHLPPDVRGVINLRGRVIGVIDLRLKFGLPAADGDQSCVVIVQVLSEQGRSVQLGVVVDSVEEVTLVAADQIEPPPAFGVTVDTAYLVGIAKLKQRVHLLLDISRVATGETNALAAV